MWPHTLGANHSFIHYSFINYNCNACLTNLTDIQNFTHIIMLDLSYLLQFRLIRLSRLLRYSGGLGHAHSYPQRLTA